MLRSCLGLALVLAAGATALSAQAAGDERILFSTSSEGGATTEFWASDAVLLKTPEWHPADGDSDAKDDNIHDEAHRSDFTPWP